MKLLQTRFQNIKNTLKELKKSGFVSPGQRRRHLSQKDPDLKNIIASLPKKQKEYAQELLHSKDSSAISEAIYQLGKMNCKAVNPILRHLVRSKRPVVKINAMWNLGTLGTPKDIPLLSRLMYDKNPQIRNQAIEMFGIMAIDEPKAKELFLKRGSVPMDQQTFKAFKASLSIFTENNLHGLYAGAKMDKRFLNEETKIARTRQAKDGSNTTLLGGKLIDKVIIREIPEKSYKAWRKAEKLGIPVEPILKRKDGRPRVRKTKRGTYLVSTKVLDGKSFFAFNRGKLGKKYRNEVGAQIKKIINRLEAANIVHGHIHPGNTLVVMENGKPKAYMIDFDQARIQHTLPAPKNK
jgi:ribosomal protein S19E (S16A)